MIEQVLSVTVIVLALFAVACAIRALRHAAAAQREVRAAKWPVRVPTPHGEVVTFENGTVFVREWGQWYQVFAPAPLDVEVLF